MKRWTTWLARLGIAGACFLVTGCGGGGVPDASTDGQAATEGTPDPAVEGEHRRPSPPRDRRSLRQIQRQDGSRPLGGSRDNPGAEPELRRQHPRQRRAG